MKIENNCGNVTIMKKNHPNFSSFYKKVIERKISSGPIYDSIMKIKNKPIRKPLGNITNYAEDKRIQPIVIIFNTFFFKKKNKKLKKKRNFNIKY